MSKSIVGQVRIKNGSNFTVLHQSGHAALIMRLGNHPEYFIAEDFNPDRFDWGQGKYFDLDLEKAMYEWFVDEDVENFENIRKLPIEEEEVVNELTGIFFNEDGEEAVEGEDLLTVDGGITRTRKRDWSGKAHPSMFNRKKEVK